MGLRILSNRYCDQESVSSRLSKVTALVCYAHGLLEIERYLLNWLISPVYRTYASLYFIFGYKDGNEVFKMQIR